MYEMRKKVLYENKKIGLEVSEIEFSIREYPDPQKKMI